MGEKNVRKRMRQRGREMWRGGIGEVRWEERGGGEGSEGSISDPSKLIKNGTEYFLFLYFRFQFSFYIFAFYFCILFLGR